MDLLQLQQNIPYKEKGTPYSLTRTIVENGQPDILFHWHTDVEIIYVHEGSAQFHIDNDYFNSQKGDIVLIRPNALHSIHPLKGVNHWIDAINFHLDLTGYSTLDFASINYLQPLYNGELDFKRVLQASDPGYAEIRETLIDAMVIGKEREEFFEFRLKAKLNELLYLFFQHGYVQKRNPGLDAYRKEDKIREIIDYISDNYDQHLTIELMADYCGYSPTHFMNFFKKHLGISCMEYLIQFRLKKASDLLLHSNFSILEISQRVGFNNLSNFNRQFKKHFQVTPSHYRKEGHTP